MSRTITKWVVMWDRINGEAVLIQSPIRLLMADWSAMMLQGMTPNLIMSILGQQLDMKFVVVDGLEKEGFLLGRSLIRMFDVLVDLNRTFMQTRNPNPRYKTNRKEDLSKFKVNVSAKLTEKVELETAEIKCVGLN